jgi:hypothetical protein
MQFQIKYQEFDKAIALVEDFLLKANLDNADPENLNF